jgi:hypothetical protein
MCAELVEAPRPAPNPIAGYENWPAAVRSAEPYVGADLGGVLGYAESSVRLCVMTVVGASMES